MQCFARLVRLLLGPSALSNNKLGFGPALEILGVQLFLSEEGYTAVPSKKTMQKCLRAVQKALAEDVLPGGAAQKLAGRLNWAGQYLFHRVGRAMLRPIYDQKFSKCVLKFPLPCTMPCIMSASQGWFAWRSRESRSAVVGCSASVRSNCVSGTAGIVCMLFAPPGTKL